MKTTLKSVIAVFGAAAMFFAGCSTFDDTEINSRVDDLEGRVSELETFVTQLNNNIDALQSLVNAVQGQDRIVSVTPVTEGDGGFLVTFEKAGPITVTNGHSASISVRQDSDGIYYWTIDGEYLLVDDAKVPATAEYGAPQMRINGETKEFEFSTDNGVTWTPCGDVATSGIGTIKDVVKGEDSVDFTLYDDSVISIPMVQSFALDIAVTDYGISANGSISIDYTVIEGDENNGGKVIPEGGFTARVNGDHESGYISLSAPAEVPNSTTILVVAVNGKGEMTGKILNIEKGVLTLIEDSHMVGSQGGTVTVSIETNLVAMQDYMVMIDPAASGWISMTSSPATKAVHTDEFVFTVAPWEDAASAQGPRTGKIMIMGTERMEFTVTQLNTVLIEGGEADFDAFSMKFGDNPINMILNDVSADGWKLTNGQYLNSTICGKFGVSNVVRLCGYANRAGVLESPVLEGGCGVLTVVYGTNKVPRFVENGLKFKVEVKNEAGESVFTQDVVRVQEDIQQNTPFEVNFNVNITGKFTVTVTNLCPSGLEDDRDLFDTNDTVVLASVAWTGYQG